MMMAVMACILFFLVHRAFFLGFLWDGWFFFRLVSLVTVFLVTVKMVGCDNNSVRFLVTSGFYDR